MPVLDLGRQYRACQYQVMSTKTTGWDGTGGKVRGLTSLYSISEVLDDVRTAFEYEEVWRSILMLSK